MATRREEVRVTADVSNFVTKFAAASTAASGFAQRLEQADGRLAGVVQTGLALAPALVPIGAAAVPAISGLVTQLGFATLAAGTTALAFSGVGDSLGALNAYQIEPTTANFAKLQQELDKLGPAGQEFVFAMQDIRPEMQRLQDVAQQGLLPGVTEGIEEFMVLMPEVEGVIATIATTLGDLSAEAGDSLNDARWRDFFDYLTVTARPTLDAMGRTFGNVVEGIANMVMAFDPLSRDFSTGLLDMSRSFADWSRNLGDNASFQQFVEYVQESGPKALDALGSLGNAFIQFVQAAAPVGDAVLPVITALGDGLAAIAASPVGPVLITAAAAVGALGRSLALLSIVGLRGGDGIMARMFDVGKITAGASAMTTVAGSTDRARMSVTQFAAAERERTATARAGMAQLGRNAGLIGGLALATTGLADKTHLSNTASLALMGTIAGPWGAAIGGAVGLTMDLAAANDDVQDAMRGMEQAASSQAVSIVDQQGALTNLTKNTNTYTDSVTRAGTLGPKSFGDIFNSASDLFTGTKDESREAVESQLADLNRLRSGAAQLYASVNQGDRSLFGAADQEIDRFITQVTPALQRAGINVRDALSDPFVGTAAALAIARYNAELDGASGKSRSVAQALNDLEGEMLSNADAAGALQTAMESLFGIQLSQSEAVDAWHQSLADLREQINGTNGAITGQTQVARDNRSVIRDSVGAVQERIAADAAAGVSGGRLVRTLLDGREAIIRQGVAAGASRRSMRAYLDTLGLTPKNLTTIIMASGVLNATQKVQALARLYRLTPKEVKTLVSEAGFAPTMAKIRALARQYHITPKQVKTFLEAVNNASPKAIKASRDAREMARTYQMKLTADNAAVFNAIAAARNAALSFANSIFSATVTARRGSAEGGYIRGPGTATSDSIPAWLSDREFVIKARAVDHYGVGFFERLNAMQLAEGGLASRSQPVGTTPRISNHLSLDGMRIEGVLDVPGFGPSRIRAIARQEANAAVDDAADFATTLTRRGA